MMTNDIPPGALSENASVMRLDETEVQLLIEGIRLKYGYDFRDYAEASIHRRVESLLRHFKIREPLDLLRMILREPEFFRKVLTHMTVTTSEIFRDPGFYTSLRENVLPILRTFPTINVWSAGCSTGEEVYSLAILFEEEELAHRTTIYATDINPRALKAAQAGIFRLEAIKLGTRNYQEAGGKNAFSQYYTADYGLAKMNSELIRNVVFSEHNLVVDQVFAECHLVLCRNVVIYFNKTLQERVYSLFSDSLRYGGYLCLGSKETLRFSKSHNQFEDVDEKWRIYRKATRGGGFT